MIRAATNPNTRRRAVTAAAIGQFVEWYDFVIYAYSASIIATLFFPDEDRAAALMATFGLYAVGFVMRPLGGVVFGHVGDRLGRRGALSIVILIMGGATFAVGLLPTYATLGIWAPVLLLICRLAQGLSAGGEAMGSNALVAEHAPRRSRGLWVGFTWSFANLPAVFAALFVLLLSSQLSIAAYESWGWRIPFLVGGVMSLIGLYIRIRVEESPAFEALRSSARVARTPIQEVFLYHRRSLLLAFSMAALSGLGFYSMTGYFSTYLTESVGLDSNDALLSNCIALLLAFVTMPAAGLLSDRIGRRPTLIAGAAISMLVAIPAYTLASDGTLLAAVLGQCLLALGLSIFFGPVGIVFLELFPTRNRYSGAAIGYNAAYLVFGGTAPLFNTWLVDVTGSLLAPAVYLTILATVVLITATRLPETYRISLVDEQDGPDATGTPDASAPVVPRNLPVGRT